MKPNVALVFFIVITIAVCVAVTHLLAVPVQVKTDPGSASNGAVAEINIVFQGTSTPVPTVAVTARGISTRRSGEVEYPITHPIVPVVTIPAP